MMLKKIILMSLLLIFYVFGGSDIPKNHLSLPVLIKLNNGILGSGLYLKSDSTFYLITAKHVLYNDANKLLANEAELLSYSYTDSASGRFRLNISLDKLEQSNKIIFGRNSDITIIEIAKRVEIKGSSASLIFSPFVKILEKSDLPILSAEVKMIRKFDKVMIGNEILIFGFPSSIGIKQIPQIEYDKPLLRKGIIAGVNSKTNTIILDCAVYPGNSGGPVIEIENVSAFETKYYLIGVVSQFIPFAEEWENKVHKYSNIEISNSSYSVVTPFDEIFELIK